MSFGAAGLILLLVLGTQIFDWYWPATLFVLAFLIGCWRIRQQAPSDYALAQILDRKLGLADRLSTVVYFRRLASAAPASVDTVERQALQRLHPDEVTRATPLQRPRSAYISAALVLMAAGMVGVRYGVLRSLDLQKPLSPLDMGLTDQPPIQAKSQKSAIQERFEEQLKQLGLSMEDLDAPNTPALKPTETTVSAISTPEGEGTPDPNDKGQSSPGAKGANESEEEGTESGEAGENAKGNGAKGDEGAPGAKEGQGQTPPPGAKPANNASQDSGLMNKMRDALSNLMNKLKTPGQSEPQTAMNQTQSQGKGQQTTSQNGKQGQGKAPGEGQQSSDQQAKGEGESGDQTAGNQSRPGDKSSDQPGNQDAKSGVGKQDGAKDIKAAEQLAAMGKISEIFGKRAAQINGEMTVEVPSGKQTLKTAYSDKKALHADLGGEANRDEIPLIYQGYVQRYFEEIRKQASKGKAR